MSLTKVKGKVLPLEKTLTSNTGSSNIGLIQGGNLQDSIRYITPQMFGAKGDYNPTTNVGTDDTASFRQAIATAITLGYRKVLIPSGYNYLITDTLNLGGVNYNGSAGIALVGENWVNTILYFRAPSNDSACVEIRGGSGIHTARYIDGFTIMPTTATRYTGVGYRIAGACFVKNGKFMVRQFAVNVHLLNDTAAGYFTEFNSFTDARIHRGLVNVLMEANGGDNSFHGNDFNNVMLTVKTTVDGGDGNTQAGVGLEIRGVTTTAYWYNGTSNIHMFGGAGAIAIKLTKANTDNITGTITGEGSLILQSTDASAFEMRGGFYSIGPVTFDVAVEPTSRASTFIFDNRLSNTSNFTSPSLPSMRPAQLPASYADRTDNGSSPAIFRALGTNIDALCYAVTGQAGTYHYFGYVPTSSNLQKFVPGIRMSYDGGSLASYSASFIIANATQGIRLTATSLEPQNDNVISSGSNSFRYTTVYAVNSTISTSDATHKTDPRDIIPDEVNAFYEIGQLPWVWMWLQRYQSEGDEARLHSGPTVQSAIQIMNKHNLDWSLYSAFCYDKTEESEIYSFRKEELLLWIVRATIEKQKQLETRLSILESK